MMFDRPPPVIDTGTNVSAEVEVVTVVVKFAPAKAIDPPSITNFTEVAILAPVVLYALTVKLALITAPVKL
jgi:hypothetical protein